MAIGATEAMQWLVGPQTGSTGTAYKFVVNMREAKTLFSVHGITFSTVVDYAQFIQYDATYIAITGSNILTPVYVVQESSYGSANYAFPGTGSASTPYTGLDISTTKNLFYLEWATFSHPVFVRLSLFYEENNSVVVTKIDLFWYRASNNDEVYTLYFYVHGT